MYENNKIFLKAFSNYFSNDINRFLQFTNSQLLIKLWLLLRHEPKNFFKHININDKLQIYNWISKNSLLLYTSELKLISDFNLTEINCKIIFGGKYLDVWKIWSLSNKDQIKFIKIIPVHYKVALSFWKNDDN